MLSCMLSFVVLWYTFHTIFIVLCFICRQPRDSFISSSSFVVSSPPHFSYTFSVLVVRIIFIIPSLVCRLVDWFSLYIRYWVVQLLSHCTALRSEAEWGGVCMKTTNEGYRRTRQAVYNNHHNNATIDQSNSLQLTWVCFA